MSFRFVSLVLLGVICSRAEGALDLTPVTSEYVEDGIAYRVVNLKNGEGKVRFSPPEGWTIRGSQARLQLNAPHGQFCEAVVVATPVGGPRVVDEAAIAAFKEEVRASLPSGCQAVTTTLEASNTIMPGGKPTFEVMVAYQLLGRTYLRSMLLLHGPEERLVFQFTSLKEDFNALHMSFRRSLASWQWVDAPTSQPAVAQNTAR